MEINLVNILIIKKNFLINFLPKKNYISINSFVFYFLVSTVAKSN